ncbi:hypothetical protein [Anaerocolumna jejuensis]|uniref:hypothetical protein n=1 Tax=Anaerocolumna jejuensis TaxID=259063 RepID=UPI003F7BFC32
MTLKPQKMRQGQDKPLSEPQKPTTPKNLTGEFGLSWPVLSISCSFSGTKVLLQTKAEEMAGKFS